MIVAENDIYTSIKDLKILNFYSDGCPPCHAFMPNFIEAEKTFGKDFDFIIVNTGSNIELAEKFQIRGTPTIVIMKNNEIVFNKSGVPNGGELKQIMIDLIGQDGNKEKQLLVGKIEGNRKKFLGLF